MKLSSFTTFVHEKKLILASKFDVQFSHLFESMLYILRFHDNAMKLFFLDYSLLLADHRVTVVFRYYDTAGIRKKYHNIQTIEISSINFSCFVMGY